MSGLFVAFEGGDGAGKSTQVRALAGRLAARGIEPLVTREPGGTWLGDHVRTLVLDPASAEIAVRAETLLYAADKAQHVAEVIRPALEAGQVVVCDRYVDSALAYQGAGRGVSLVEVAPVMAWATSGLTPDLTVLLDVLPADGLATITSHDRLEAAGAEFHERVRRSFLDLAAAHPARYLVLDARQDVDAIAEQVFAAIEPMLAQVGS